jgi:hypothetical protein
MTKERLRMVEAAPRARGGRLKTNIPKSWWFHAFAGMTGSDKEYVVVFSTWSAKNTGAHVRVSPYIFHVAPP